MTSPLAIIILAAGKGTRMRSNLPKVLHPLAGKPMILHVLATVQPLNPTKTIVITGHEADQVEDTIHAAYPNATCIRQTEQLGTGHAVLQAQTELEGFDGDVVIINGDVPLLTTTALQSFIQTHQEVGNTFSLGSTHATDPTGLGRILRDSAGHFLANQEHKDCSPEELTIQEVGVGIYATHGPTLFETLRQVSNDNTQGEYYLPDIMHLGKQAGHTVDALPFPQPAAELGGINTREQLANNEVTLQDRYRRTHMLAGVTLQDPASTYFCVDTQIEPDVTIEPHVVFGPGVAIASGATIRAFSHLEDCTVKQGATVGPFARLRPGTVLEEAAKVGNFVEVKKSTIGAGSKVNHLTYIGDTTIGAGTNIGGGVVMANYDHHSKTKHQTNVGDNVAIGANSVLVAPVNVGNNAKIGALSAVREDVPADHLMLTSGETIRKPRKK